MFWAEKFAIFKNLNIFQAKGENKNWFLDTAQRRDRDYKQHFEYGTPPDEHDYLDPE